MATDYVGHPTILIGAAMYLERESVGNAVERSEDVPGKIRFRHIILRKQAPSVAMLQGIGARSS